MALNEATRVRRERYPLKFDLEGVPTAERDGLIEVQKLKEEQMKTHLVQNNFNVNYQQGGAVMDINNPPSPYANGRYVHQEYPKLMYPAGYPQAKAVQVDSAEQEKLQIRKGLTLTPRGSETLPSAEDLDVVEQEKEVAVKTRLKPGPKPKVQQEQAS